MEVRATSATACTKAPLATSTAAAASWAAERDSLLDDLIEAQERLCEVEEERNEALQAIREGACAGNGVFGERCGATSCTGRDHNDDGSDTVRADGVCNASCIRSIHDDDVANSTKYDDLRASVEREKSEPKVALRGDSSSDHDGAAYGDATASTRHGQSSLVNSGDAAVNTLRALEGPESREAADTLVVSNDDMRDFPEQTRSGLTTENEGSMDFGNEATSGYGGSCDDECVCGAPASASRKLFNAQLELGRARAAMAKPNARVVGANKRAAMVSEDAIASRYDRRELERALGDRDNEVSCRCVFVSASLLMETLNETSPRMRVVMIWNCTLLCVAHVFQSAFCPPTILRVYGGVGTISYAYLHVTFGLISRVMTHAKRAHLKSIL